MSLLDTDPRALQRHVDLMRDATPAQRLVAVRSLSATVASLSRRALRRSMPDASEWDIDVAFVALHYGDSVAAQLRSVPGAESVSTPDLLAALEPVIDALERLDVRYQVGGSVASSVHGMARATMNVDIVADLESTHVDALVDALEEGYFVDQEAVRSAVRRRSSFTLIHQGTMMKVDVFLPRQRSYDQQALSRGTDDTFVDDAGARPITFASPEDVVLAKLEWYRLGNETPERQWADVLGVLRVQRNRLDLQYLQRWAIELEVDDLLDRASEEVAD